MKTSTKIVATYIFALVLVSIFSIGIALAQTNSTKGENNLLNKLNVVKNKNTHNLSKIKEITRIRITHHNINKNLNKARLIKTIIEEKRKILKQIWKNMTPEERKAFLLMSKEEIVKIAQEGKLNKIKDIVEKREDLEKKDWRIRIVKQKEKIKALKKINERLNKIKERLRKKEKVYNELKKLRNTYKKCIENNNTTEKCDNITKEYINKSKEYLTDTIDVAIDAIKATEEKIKSSEYLNNTQINKIIEGLDNEINLLSTLKDNITACENIECIKNNAIRLKKNLYYIKWNIKKPIYIEELNRIGVITRRADAILARLDLLLEKASKYNLSQEKRAEIENKTEKIKNLVKEAESTNEEAKEYFEKAKELIHIGKMEEGKEYLEISKEKFEKAKQNLKEANIKLQEIWNLVKEKKEMRRVFIERDDRLTEDIKVEYGETENKGKVE